MRQMKEKYSDCSCDISRTSIPYLPLIAPEITDQDFEHLLFVLKCLNESKEGNNNLKSNAKNTYCSERELKALLDIKFNVEQHTLKNNLPSLFQSYFILKNNHPTLTFIIQRNSSKSKPIAPTKNMSLKHPIEKKLFTMIPKIEDVKSIEAFDYSISEHDIYDASFDSSSCFNESPSNSCVASNKSESRSKSSKKAKITIKNGVLRSYLTSAMNKHLELSKKYYSRNSEMRTINSIELIVKNLSKTLRKEKNANTKVLYRSSTSKNFLENAQAFRESKESRRKKIPREVRKERVNSLVSYWVARDKNKVGIPAEAFIKSALERHKTRLSNKTIDDTKKFSVNSRNRKNNIRTSNTFYNVKSSLKASAKRTNSNNRHRNSGKPIK